jgi:hypothetical protein
MGELPRQVRTLVAANHINNMEEKPTKPNQNQINIELPAEVANGVYANLAIISHSPTEFVVDFIQVLPGTPKAQVRSRVILAPQHAKRLLYALKDNIDKYERTQGEIDLGESVDEQTPPNFSGPAGYA